MLNALQLVGAGADESGTRQPDCDSCAKKKWKAWCARYAITRRKSSPLFYRALELSRVPVYLCRSIKLRPLLTPAAYWWFA